MRIRRYIAFALMSFPAALTAQSSGQLPLSCQKALDNIHAAADRDARRAQIIAALEVGERSNCMAQLLIQRAQSKMPAKQEFASFIKKLESIRNDKQAGSSTGSGGTSNLVSKGTTAQILSLAAEYGALTESVNKQIVTVQGSLDGLPAALVRKNLIPYCPPNDPTQNKDCVNQGALNLLRRFSYGVSFDTSQNADTVSGMASGQPSGTTQPVSFTANRHQISAITGRAVLWNARDATSKTFQTKWLELLKTSSGTATTPSSADLNAAGDDLFSTFKQFLVALKLSDDELRSWRKDTAAKMSDFEVADLTDTKWHDLQSAWRVSVDDYLDRVQKAHPDALDKAVELIQKSNLYAFEETQFVEAIAVKPVLTFEYNNNRPVGQDETSNFRLIFDKGFGPKWSFTANGALTVYDSTLPKTVPNVSRIRDAQAAIQFQRELGDLLIFGTAALAGTYYFQYQNSPAILNVTPGMPLPGITLTGLPGNATQVFAQKGNLHIAQLRLVLGPGSSTVRFPVAVSYSNRTELIAKPTWKAQFGVSYDFDSLFSK